MVTKAEILRVLRGRGDCFGQGEWTSPFDADGLVKRIEAEGIEPDLADLPGVPAHVGFSIEAERSESSTIVVNAVIDPDFFERRNLNLDSILKPVWDGFLGAKLSITLPYSS